MSTLEGAVVVVVGGSSGIGFAVAKLALLNGASRVVIASSDSDKVTAAVGRLVNELEGKAVTGQATGQRLDAKDAEMVKEFFESIGPIDHLVWTGGDRHAGFIGYPNVDIEAAKSMFDVRFWGPAIAGQAAQIREGGSITLTTGTPFYKPLPGYSLGAGINGATDAMTRGMALDLAPIRVNSVSPGIVNTELWNAMPAERREAYFQQQAQKLPVRHIADPEEVAEAYIFLMKCRYVTAQSIRIDGGYVLKS